MAEVASAYVSLLPSTKGFGTRMSSDLKREVNGSASTLGKGFGRLFAATAGALAAIGIGGFLKDSIAEAREAQKVTAATEAIIKATGSAAGITADQVGKMAGRLSLVTGVDDELIQKSENLLLTFKNVKNYVGGQFVGVFDEATAAALDLSAAGFGSMDSAAKMLGKALNDPLKGLTALGRAGVTFSAQQQERIKGLVEEGNILKAQQIILKEVQSQVGGVAEASATAGEKARVAWDNLKEQLGTALLPVIDRLATFFTTRVVPAISQFITEVQTGTGVGGEFRDVFTQVVTTLGQVLTFVRENALALGVFVGALTAVKFAVDAWRSAQLLLNFALAANPVGIVVVAIAALAAGIIYAYQHSEKFREVVQQIGAFIAETFKPTLDALGATFREDIVPAAQDLIDLFKEYRPQIEAVTRVTLKLIAAYVAMEATILGKVLPPLIKAAGWFAGGMVDGMVKTIHAIDSIIQWFGRMELAVLDAVESAKKFLAGMKANLDAAVTYVKTIPGRIKAGFGDTSRLLFNVGIQIIQGLLNGIRSAAASIKGAMIQIARDAIEAALSILHISSPSKVFHWIGEMTMAGLEDGIKQGGPKAVKAMVDQLTTLRDKAKEQLSGLREEFTSLASTIASAFTPDLFQATSLGDFMSQGNDAFGELLGLKKAFKKLKGWGLSPQFLAQLFASGNGALILDLADSSRGEAQSAAALFGDIGSLSQQLGNTVAKEAVGPKIDKTNKRLEQIEDAIKHIGRDVSHALNSSFSDGHRRRVPA